MMPDNAAYPQPGAHPDRPASPTCGCPARTDVLPSREPDAAGIPWFNLGRPVPPPRRPTDDAGHPPPTQADADPRPLGYHVTFINELGDKSRPLPLGRLSAEAAAEVVRRAPTWVCNATVTHEATDTVVYRGSVYRVPTILQGRVIYDTPIEPATWEPVDRPHHQG
jgi:hypothetical protein